MGDGREAHGDGREARGTGAREGRGTGGTRGRRETMRDGCGTDAGARVAIALP